jgi:CDP-paratose 2-epimerase
VIRDMTVLITGGAGFVGSNLADRLAGDGAQIVLYDNFSRPRVHENAAWLKERHGDRIQIEVGDVRDAASLAHAVAQAGRVYHFAAQVAVTSSVEDPVADFEINARGTLNLLEAIRALGDAAPSLVFASTNKVYGKLGGLDFAGDELRYVPTDTTVHACGIAETQPLELYSPYGCSKGAADQYVLDYARIYGLRACVFRMSCLYGPRQFGTEDQGWVAHFLIRALQGLPITLFGDGRQVRDVLFVDDVVDAFLLGQDQMKRCRGHAFNIGGGPANATSLLELLQLIARVVGITPEIRFADWRPGDQLYYVSDTSRFTALTGWQRRVGIEDGVRRLHEWLAESHPRESGDVRSDQPWSPAFAAMTGRA